MGKTKLDETYIFRISIIMQFFRCSYSYQNFIFRVLITIELGRSLLQFVTTNCLIFAFSAANLIVLLGLGLFLFVPVLILFWIRLLYIFNININSYINNSFVGSLPWENSPHYSLFCCCTMERQCGLRHYLY